MVHDDAKASGAATAGMVGGIAFAAGAAFSLYADLAARSHLSVHAALLLVAFGGCLLGIAWVGMFRRGLGGAGAISGSFAVPLAVAFSYVPIDEPFDDIARLKVLLIAGSLTWFALGHTVARGLRVARVAAVAAAAAFAFELIAMQQHWTLSRSAQQLVALVAFGGLLVLASALAVIMPRLGAPPIEDASPAL